MEQSSSKKYVVVTGASTGIGLATAKDLIQNGWGVFGCVRKKADAERLQTELGPALIPLMVDVTDGAAIKAAAEKVRQHIGNAGLQGLVNNAGVGVGGPVMHIPLDEMRRQFEINLFGVVAMIQEFLPLLGAVKPCTFPPGRIINVSSVAGKVSAPFMGAYVASKHALEGISHTLRRELIPYGVDVIIVAPGAVKTPIWDKAEQEDFSIYQNTIYEPLLERFTRAFIKRGRSGYPPERVAQAIRVALESSRPKTRYAVVPKALTNWILPRMLPDRWLDRLLAKMTGLAALK